MSNLGFFIVLHWNIAWVCNKVWWDPKDHFKMQMSKYFCLSWWRVFRKRWVLDQNWVAHWYEQVRTSWSTTYSTQLSRCKMANCLWGHTHTHTIRWNSCSYSKKRWEKIILKCRARKISGILFSFMTSSILVFIVMTGCSSHTAR